MGQRQDPYRQGAPGWAQGPPTSPTGYPAQAYPPVALPQPVTHAPYGPGPGRPPSVPAAAAAPHRPWGAAVLGLVAGLVIAVVAGAVLVATHTLHFGSAPRAAVGAQPLTLPAELAGFSDLVAANKAVLGNSSLSDAKKASVLAGQQANQEEVSRLTIASYQRANPGAAVAYRSYADPKLLHFASVVAVRAGYPGLTIGPVVDPAFLGLAVAQQQVKSFGDVDCVVAQADLTQAGSPVDPATDLTTMCQRTSGALTVQVYGQSFKGAADQQSMVQLTRSAWAAVAS